MYISLSRRTTLTQRNEIMKTNPRMVEVVTASIIVGKHCVYKGEKNKISRLRIAWKTKSEWTGNTETASKRNNRVSY